MGSDDSLGIKNILVTLTDSFGTPLYRWEVKLEGCKEMGFARPLILGLCEDTSSVKLKIPILENQPKASQELGSGSRKEFWKSPSTPRAWSELMSFRPSHGIQKRLKNRKMRVQKIEKAKSSANLDYYPVVVTLLPKPSLVRRRSREFFRSIKGLTPLVPSPEIRLSPQELLQVFRASLTSQEPLVDRHRGIFSPYDKELDKDSELGSVIHIRMILLREFNPDDGSVVCSALETEYFRLSTVWAPLDFWHPVSGNREFGFWKVDLREGAQMAVATQDLAVPGAYSLEAPTYVFYTMGADCVAHGLASLSPGLTLNSGGEMWKSFQERFVNYIRKNGGEAYIPDGKAGAKHPWSKTVVHRLKWSEISKYHNPVIDWLD